MRVVFWNIRAGGGRRVDAIARQLASWEPDVLGLCEFRCTPPSAALAALLASNGLAHQCATTIAPGGSPSRSVVNCLLLASRWPLRRIRLRPEPHERGRWLVALVDGPTPLTVGAMHVPNRVTGRKDLFFADVLRMLRGWRRGPTLLLGDTNSGLPDIDEEAPAFGPREVAWIHALERLGWSDAFRLIHGARRAYTWYSPNGRNGFRIDHAFVNRALRPSVHDVRYDWGAGIQGALSDHAALLLELDGSLRADFRGIRPGLPAGRALP